MILKIFILSLMIPSHSQVNLRDGGLELEHKVLPVRSFYQSRSLFRGELGLGWWLDYETHLEFLPDQKVLWHHGPRQRPFSNSQTSTYGLWHLKCADSLCEIRHQQGSFYLFSSQGHLLSWQDSEQNTFTIVKMGIKNRPHVIRHLSKNHNYTLIRDPNSHLLHQLGSFQLTYGKGEQSDLLTSISHLKSKESYTYSVMSNLTRIRGKDELSIKYNEELDQVVELIAPDQCRIQYKYDSQQTKDFLKLTTLRTRKCPAQAAMISTHTHDFILNHEDWALIQSKVQWQDKTWEVNYDPYTQEVQTFTSPRARGNH